MKYRIIYNILLFLAIALTPWPVYTGLVLAGMFLFHAYLEAFIWIVVIEVMFSPTSVGLFGHYYVLVLFPILFIIIYIKKRMRYYD